MPRHEIVYDPVLKETPEWKSLYSRYKNNTQNIYRDAFRTFQEFYDWSMANGFVIGAKISRVDYQKPFTKDNLRWEAPHDKTHAPEYDAEKRRAIEKWNETVNRIRKHYGMEPLERKKCDETLL